MSKVKLFRYILLAVPLATVMLLAGSCGGGGGGKGTDPVKPETIVSVTFKQPEVEATKGSQFINISSNGSWILSSSQSWLKVSQSNGTGSTSSVSVSYDENTGSSSRTAILTLNCAGKTATATLTQKGKGEEPSPATSPGWIELPELKSGTGHKFVTHSFTGKSLRSFSYDWNSTDLVANWVAYPLNKGLIGSGGRSDAWGLDPKLTSAEQPILASGYKGSYDRGHQLPSADRLTYAENVKTFYYTNMTPQMNAFNGQIWLTAESMVRGWSTSSDTLYVVTGCVVKGSSKKAYDNNGKAVTVPVAYYKAVVRYVKNSTLGYSGYMGLAMYFEHKSYSHSNINNTMTDIVMSIDALEAKLGLDLFPNLVTVAGKSVSDQVEAEDPTKVSFWW